MISCPTTDHDLIQPFLLSLGLQPALVSLVCLAGPVCATVLQPYVGFKSDNCTHGWGRRKPFMVYGTFATVVCMISLSWTPESLGFVCRLFGGDSNSHLSQSLVRLVAIAWTWALNIALQPVQASARALIVDSTPASQQAQSSAFASCAVIVGSAFGYGWGFVKLPSRLVDGQFKGLCLVASGALAVTVTITCTMMEDSPAAKRLDDHTGRASLRQVYVEIRKRTAQ